MDGSEIRRKNKQCIESRIRDGIALLREYYLVEERDLDPQYAHPLVAGSPCNVRSFDIWDVGNLVAVSATEAEESQFCSFAITPYYKNLPLFSSDYVYAGADRSALLELFVLSVGHDELYD